MGKVHAQGSWLIRVQGNEHPPIHVHLLHPDGRAIIHLDGTVLNRGVPAAVLAQACEWVATHNKEIRAEWRRMDNPSAR